MKRECTLKKGIREGGRSDCLKVVLLVFAWDRVLFCFRKYSFRYGEILPPLIS